MTDTADGGKDLRMGGQNRALQWNRESDDAALPEQSPAGVAQSVPLAIGQWTCVEFGIVGPELRTWVDGNEIAGLHAAALPPRTSTRSGCAEARGGQPSPISG